MCPHEDDDRKRRPTEDSVEQLRVQEHGRSNRRDLREHVDAGERGGDDERARSEEMTMSSYAESVVETYRRATRRTMNSIPTAAITETTRTATVASTAESPSNSADSDGIIPSRCDSAR